ncbi:hypothetical protein LH442_09075 [Laribacter hongkongensis]|nr:hypothetical protein [Laribacter hongkongensis]MCG9056143.1 hypothetical protein [Laribacter hongkongensis]
MNLHKTRYRTTNWPEYNRSLQNRGHLTIRYRQPAASHPDRQYSGAASD